MLKRIEFSGKVDGVGRAVGFERVCDGFPPAPWGQGGGWGVYKCQMVCPGDTLQCPSDGPIQEKEVTQSLPGGWGEMGSETFCVHLSQREAGAHPQKPAIHGGLSGTSNRMFGSYWNQNTQKAIYCTHGEGAPHPWESRGCSAQGAGITSRQEALVVNNK